MDFDDGERWSVGIDVQRRYLELLDRDAASVAHARENAWRGPAHRCRISCIVRGECPSDLHTWGPPDGRPFLDYDALVERSATLVRNADRERWMK